MIKTASRLSAAVGLALAALLISGPATSGAATRASRPAEPAPELATPTPAASLPAEPAPAAAVQPAALFDLDLPGLAPEVLRLALDAAGCAADRGLAAKSNILTVIDYSLPSSQRRLWVFDLARRELLFHELVSHGKNTGELYATRFSNTSESLQTSLGLFVTDDTYYGKNGYSLRLDGLEPGVNDLARPRTIVIHGAPYVSAAFLAQHGRLGRSWGCPALDLAVARDVIDTIKGGSFVFAYYPDERWLGSSRFLGCGQGAAGPAVTAAR